MYVMMAMPLATTACIQRVGHCFTPPPPPKKKKKKKKMFVLSVFYLQCSYFPSFAVFKLFVVFCSTENVHTFHVLRKMFIYIRDEVVSVSRWVRHITLM